MNIIAIIPARGGSKGIPRKNVRLLNNKPLISYTIEAAKSSKYINEVIVSTDDIEIAQVARSYGAKIIDRDEELAGDSIPLDPVIFDATLKAEKDLGKLDYVITIQPTSPLLTVSTLDAIIERMVNNPSFDTLLTVKDDRHLAWTTDEEGNYIPKYKERLNRQYLPSEYRETGAVLICKREIMTSKTRFGKQVSLFIVPAKEAVDIDSPEDWWVAEKLLKRKKVMLHTTGNHKVGMGHVYRSLTLAAEMIDHEVIFLIEEKNEIGIKKIKSNNYPVIIYKDTPYEEIKSYKPDIVVNDILDTDFKYMNELKKMGIRIINFEDLGEGASLADGVINALYPGNVPNPNFYTGELYECLRAEFMNAPTKLIGDKVENVLITYGGTDPNNLTLKTLKGISSFSTQFKIKVILGPGYENEKELNDFIQQNNLNIEIKKEVYNMAQHMVEADIIFSSAGRTMYEIASIGTPAVITAQNYRELTHMFGHAYNGFVNMGYHEQVTEQDYFKIMNNLSGNKSLRELMNQRMLSHDLKSGIQRVMDIIFDN